MTALPLPASVPPFDADPLRVATYADHVLSCASSLDDLGGFATGPARDCGLQGQIAEDYVRGLGRIGTEADEASLALQSAARRVYHHADVLTGLQVRRAELVARRAELADLIDAIVAADAADVSTVETVARQVTAYDEDVLCWRAELQAAEDEVISALRRVGTLRQAETAYAGKGDPADGIAVPPRGTAPAQVASWWARLTRAQRWALITDSPDAIGNLDGVPAWARNRANSAAVDRDLADLGRIPTKELSDEQRRRLQIAQSVAAARDRLGGVTDPVTGQHPPVFVYQYDPDAFGGDGAVTMGVGDLDTADNVAVTVPGMGTDATSAPAQADKAANLYEASRYADGDHTTATMFWIGYDAPNGDDVTGVVTDAMARAGGHRLADMLDGIDASRSTDPHLTVIGHSYGSTTASEGAAQAQPGQIDDLVTVGSPGAGPGIDHASDVDVPAGHYWDGRNSHDPIVQIGEHDGALSKVPTGIATRFGLPPGPYALGHDPGSADFGAQRFEAEDVHRDDGGLSGLIGNHTRYFDPDTESLDNMSHIVTGQYGAVHHAPGVPDPPHRGPVSTVRDGIDGGLGIAGHAGHLGYDGVKDLLGGHVDWKDALVDQGRGAAGDLNEILGGPHDPESDRDPTTPQTEPRG